MTRMSRDGERGLVEKDGDDDKHDGRKIGTVDRSIMPVIEEGVAPKALRQPYQPTQKQIDEHELTHIPFRDWCVHCMRGRGQSNQHRIDQCGKSKGEGHDWGDFIF